MSDSKVLAVRRLVEAVPNRELVTAVPGRQTIVKIETGRPVRSAAGRMRCAALQGNPMTAGEVATKALALIAPVLGDGRARELIARDSKRFGPLSALRRLSQT